MLEFATTVAMSVDQVPTVNCQLIIRSELLELPYLELCERITEEAEENPALEVEVRPPSIEQWNWRAWWDAPLPPGNPGPPESQDPTLRAPARYTLRDELRWRAACATNERERRIVDYLIEHIDERGYLNTSVFDASLELGVEETEVEAALRRLQSLSMPGVGARDLRECLLLQLEALPEEPPHVRQIIQHTAELTERGGYAHLCRSLGLSREQLESALSFVRHNLHPYPGEQFHPPWQHLLPDNPYAAQPDALVSLRNGQLQTELLSSRNIVVRLSEAYRRLDEGMRAQNLRAGDAATKYARAQVRAARQLIWSLDQRNRGLYKVTQAIVEAQADFFREGPLALKPLSHKQVAETTGLHESTVSRAVAGKLLMMPSGEVAPYSLFFDDALPAKTVMKGLIASEASDAPLTDDQLQRLLAERGFDLARRTVTKYRHALGIPSSSQRKERGFDLARRTVTKYRHALGIPSSSQRKAQAAA